MDGDVKSRSKLPIDLSSRLDRFYDDLSLVAFDTIHDPPRRANP